MAFRKLVQWARCCRVYREVMWKVRRTIFPYDATVHATLSHSSFLTWLKSIFWYGRRLAHLLDRVVRLLRYGARRAGERAPCLEIMQRQTPAPDSPARRRAAEVKMVGYTTVAHGGAQRLSEKWRHFVVHCLYSLFCTSPRCVGVREGAAHKRGKLMLDFL